MSKIICVVPTIRPESMEKFRTAWTPLFEKHSVTLITVWDGERPHFTVKEPGREEYPTGMNLEGIKDLFCRFTDACRNLGFVLASNFDYDYLLTLDDDVTPLDGDVCFDNWDNDPIQSHLDVLNKRVPLSWMNTAHMDSDYLRGVPYGVRDEAPVMLSHGVWGGTPDYDGETQLRLEKDGGVPYSLPYYVGPIPKGVLFPLCGMNVMVRREALPYFYFAPMGKDTGILSYRDVDQTSGGTHTFEIPLLNRFADIWMGIFLKREFDKLGWACYTGTSVIHHTRASDAKKNMEQEKLGREWGERLYHMNASGNPLMYADDEKFQSYFHSYADKRQRYADLIRSIQGGGK